MGILDGAADLFGRESAIFVGLLIPFLGLLVPAIALFAIGLSHRRAPHVATAPGGASPQGDGAAPVATATTVAEEEGRAGLVAPDELSWLCQCLRESDVFEGLTDDELRLVVAIGEQRQVPAGERLANAGSRGENLFVILKGEIQLLSHAPAEVVVRTARVGQTVPLAAIIDPPVLVTTVEATTDCAVFAIPRQPLIDLLELHPMMGFQVYRAVARSFEHRYRQTLDQSGTHQGPHGTFDQT
jgi:hypothetical protein